MAKEFKDFDKRYAAFKGKFLGYELDNGFAFNSDTYKIGVWKYAEYYSTKASAREILEAVYGCDDYGYTSAFEWQRFRVSMKGFTTQEKLARLEYRWDRMWSIQDQAEAAREYIRINNYIGALVRGGQLNTRLEVVR